DCTDSSKTTEGLSIEKAKELFYQTDESVMVDIEKLQKRNFNKYKKNPIEQEFVEVLQDIEEARSEENKRPDSIYIDRCHVLLLPDNISGYTLLPDRCHVEESAFGDEDWSMK
ncbi:hypothetical protein Tco_0130464, partial [Tanacetum coccineum]